MSGRQWRKMGQRGERGRAGYGAPLPHTHTNTAPRPFSPLQSQQAPHPTPRRRPRPALLNLDHGPSCWAPERSNAGVQVGRGGARGALRTGKGGRGGIARRRLPPLSVREATLSVRRALPR